MTVDFGKLDLEKIDIVIDDLDNCLFPYPKNYAERFSMETARAAKLMAKCQIHKGSEDERLVALLCANEDDLIEDAKQSYADHGFTTRVFANEYGLNEVELYQGHHYLICRDVVKPTFNRFAKPRLQQGVQLLFDAGLRQFVFTNGTQFYAEDVTQQLGLKNYYNMHFGIDSYNDYDAPRSGKIILLPKHVRQAWQDFIQHANIRTYVSEEELKSGVKPFLIGQEREKGKNYKLWNYSHCVFFDDSPENLKIAKQFGMQTVLVQTDRVQYDPQKMSYIDAVTDNIGEFKCHMASEILRQNKVAEPDFQTSRRLVSV